MKPGEIDGAETRAALRVAFRKLLNPLVAILVRSGMVSRDLEEIVRQVFVDVAVSSEFAIDGKAKVSNTRVAILTGLTRKEVAKLVKKKRDSEDGVSNFSRVARVLNEWQRNPRYTGAYGVPLELPFDADGNQPSFSELVRLYSGDMLPRAMLDELTRIGAVTEVDDFNLRLQTSTYLPAPMDKASIEHLGSVMRRLADTLDHNNNPENLDKKRVERFALADRGFPVEKYENFQDFVRERATNFLEAVNTWMAENELSIEEFHIEQQKADAGRPHVETVLGGVAVFQFVESEMDFEKNNID